MVVPNRAGIWGHMETTPFGHGAPFGKNQLRRMLADALFEVDHRQTLLAVPPQRPFGWMDRPPMQIAPRTGGLHVLRAMCECCRGCPRGDSPGVDGELRGAPPLKSPPDSTESSPGHTGK